MEKAKGKRRAHECDSDKMRPSETHEGARGRQETEWCIRAGCAPGRHGLRGREQEHEVD